MVFLIPERSKKKTLGTMPSAGAKLRADWWAEADEIWLGAGAFPPTRKFQLSFTPYCRTSYYVHGGRSHAPQNGRRGRPWKN